MNGQYRTEKISINSCGLVVRKHNQNKKLLTRELLDFSVTVTLKVNFHSFKFVYVIKIFNLLRKPRIPKFLLQLLQIVNAHLFDLLHFRDKNKVN